MALPHLILSDVHSTSVGYSFPTAVANLCVTKDIFAGKYLKLELHWANKAFFFIFCSAAKSFQKCSFTKYFFVLCSELQKLNCASLKEYLSWWMFKYTSRAALPNKTWQKLMQVWTKLIEHFGDIGIENSEPTWDLGYIQFQIDAYIYIYFLQSVNDVVFLSFPQLHSSSSWCCTPCNMLWGCKSF